MRLRNLFLIITATIICSQLAGQTLNESFTGNFPPELWRVYSLDGGQFTWNKSTVKFLSSPGCARVRSDGRTITNDDWLVTRKVYPVPGVNTLWFSYRSHNPRRESLEVYVSTTNNRPEDFSFLLTAFGFNNPTYLEQNLSLAQFDSTPIYIAFRYPKRFGRAIYLDNIVGPAYVPVDVGVKAIVAPPSYLLIGTNVNPQVLVKNFGWTNQNEISVALSIIDSASGLSSYNGLQIINELAAQDSILVTFPETWQAEEGVYQVTAFTILANDMDLTNDTTYKRTQVVYPEITDVAVTGIINPVGTLPPGIITPAANVANYGTNSASFSVAFDIILNDNLIYTDTVSVFLEPNVSTSVNFANWDATSGVYQSIVKALIENDVDTTNNTLTDMFEIISYYRDVGATRIIAPVGEILQYSSIQPQAEVENFGDLTESFYIKLRIGAGYKDSVNMTLAAGERRTVNFQEWNANEIGTFAIKCSTNLSGDEDPLNDFVDDSVIVIPGTGLNENSPVTPVKTTPNPFGQTTTFSLKNHTNLAITIYNTIGVPIKTLRVNDYFCWDGTDDLGNLLPKGIYFARITTNTAHWTKKIVFR